MFVSLQNLYVEISTLKMMVLGDGTFGRQIDYRGGTLINGISALVQEAAEKSLIFHHVRLQQKVNHQDLGFPSLHNYKKYMYVIYKTHSLLYTCWSNLNGLRPSCYWCSRKNSQNWVLCLYLPRREAQS